MVCHVIVRVGIAEGRADDVNLAEYLLTVDKVDVELPSPKYFSIHFALLAGVGCLTAEPCR